LVPAVQLHAQDAAATQNCTNFLQQFNIRGDATNNPFSWVNPARYCTIQGFLYWILQMAFVFAGVVAVLFVVLGGYWYLTSAGNEEQAEKGRKVLVNAIVGLVIIIMAFALVRIVINTVTGNLAGSGTSTSGSSTNTMGNGQQAAGSQTNPGAASFSGPSQAEITKNYSFSVTVPKSLAVYYCKDTKPSFICRVQGADGSINNLPSPTLMQEGDNYIMNFSIVPSNFNYIDQPGAPTTRSMVINLQICGQPLSDSWSVPLVNSPASSGSSGMNADVQAAAQRTTFTASLTNGGKGVHVNVNSAISDLQVICGVAPSYLGEKQLEVFVNGKSVGTDTATSPFADFPLSPPVAGSAIVAVKICGVQIGSGGQTVSP